MKRILFLITVLLATTSTPSLGSNQSLLNHITHKIASIKNFLHRDHSRRQKLQNDLRNAETNTGKITQQLGKTNKNLRLQRTLLANLKSNEKKYQAKLNEQKTLLDRQIQTAYMLGRQPYLKFLLNQEDSNEVSRVMMYYHYINQNRLQAITDIQQTLAQIKSNQEKIQSHYHLLITLKTQQKNQKEHLAISQKNRRHLISILNKHIKTRQQRLDALLTNKHQLKKTIQRVGQRAVNFPKTNFAKLYNHLHWPTQGRVLQIYGTQIEQSELRWDGVLIKAPEGQPIYAVAKGKVVFAKWLSGYGLLLIVNHGNGYMTLYGRNHVLYKKIGDIVHRGDLMATVGQTGGYKSPSLYFAVRHNGKPINPALFIIGRGEPHHRHPAA